MNPQPSQLPPDIPLDAIPFLQNVGYLDAYRLHLGDSVPQLTASGPEGEEIALCSLWQKRQAVIIFGSYT